MKPLFIIGQLVRLKSGGPVMTVCSVRDKDHMLHYIKMHTQWFDQEHRLHVGEFDQDCLKAVDVPGGEHV